MKDAIKHFYLEHEHEVLFVGTVCYFLYILKHIA
jgi:hypothetical protein